MQLRTFVLATVLMGCCAASSAQERLTAPPESVKQAPLPLILDGETIPAPQGVDLPGFSLPELTDVALTNSPRLRRAWADAEQARGEMIQAGLYPNPRFDSGNPQTLGGASSVYTGGLTQEVVRGGKLKLDRAAAEQRFASLQMEYAGRRIELITEIRRQFIVGLAMQMRLDLLRNLLRISEQSEQTTENLLKAGESSTADVLLIRVERRKEAAAVQALEATVVGQKRQLAALAGVPGLDIERFYGDLNFALPAMDDAEFVRAVTSENPAVRSAAFDIARNRFLLQRAVVEPIPNVAVQAGGQYSLGQPHTQGVIGLYFDVPIWNRNQGGIRAAQAGLSGSVAELNSVQNDLVRRLADALSRYRAAENQINVYESGILPDSEESLTIVRRGFETGRYDVLRLLQAQRNYFESHLGYLEARENRSTAAADVAGLLQLEVMPSP